MILWNLLPPQVETATPQSLRRWHPTWRSSPVSMSLTEPASTYHSALALPNAVVAGWNMEDIEHLVRKPANRLHATPILLLHGAWHGAWCWEYWLDYFASLGYEVHAFSLPGHGASSRRKPHINFYTPGDYVSTLAAQIAQVSPTPVVVGHSMGGAILQKYLESSALPGAVLLATLPASGNLGMMWRLLRRHPIAVLKSLVTLNLYHWVATEELAKDLFLGPAALPADVRRLHERLVRETAVLSQLSFPFAKPGPIATPMMVLAGEKDVIFTIAEERATAEKYGADFVVFEGQAHDLILEPSWRQVADTIDEWISNRLKLP
jgi:pimeloyl-ACP methyl ester carboxylesterase